MPSPLKSELIFIADTNATMWVHFEGEMAQGGHAKDEIWTDPEGFKKPKSKRLPARINALPLAASEKLPRRLMLKQAMVKWPASVVLAIRLIRKK